MLRDRRWSTLYKGFTITQRNSGWYYTDAHLYDTMYDTNLSNLKKQINNTLKLEVLSLRKYNKHYNKLNFTEFKLLLTGI